MGVTLVHPKGHPLPELETVSSLVWILMCQVAEGTSFDELQLVEPLHMEEF